MVGGSTDACAGTSDAVPQPIQAEQERRMEEQLAGISEVSEGQNVVKGVEDDSEMVPDFAPSNRNGPGSDEEMDQE